jgi:uncharacterized protein (TIGR00369 family)
VIIAREILIGMVAYVPQMKALGVRYIEHGDTWVVLQLPYADQLVGFPETGIIAGGAIFSMMDNASGMAVMCASKTYLNMATLDLRIDYLKPATKGRDVFARMECYKQTKSVSFTRGIADHDAPENPIAHASGTFMTAAGISSPGAPGKLP